MDEQIENLKDHIVVKIAEHISKRYEYRWVKCVDLAMQASWWNKDYTIDELEKLDVDDITKQVFTEIEQDKIS